MDAQHAVERFGKLEAQEINGSILVGVALKDAEGFSVAEVIAGLEDEDDIKFARLFAAAPEMLDALRAVKTYLVNLEAGDESDTLRKIAHKKLHETLDTAIAKATK